MKKGSRSAKKPLSHSNCVGLRHLGTLTCHFLSERLCTVVQNSLLLGHLIVHFSMAMKESASKQMSKVSTAKQANDSVVQTNKGKGQANRPVLGCSRPTCSGHGRVNQTRSQKKKNPNKCSGVSDC